MTWYFTKKELNAEINHNKNERKFSQRISTSDIPLNRGQDFDPANMIYYTETLIRDLRAERDKIEFTIAQKTAYLQDLKRYQEKRNVQA